MTAGGIGGVKIVERITSAICLDRRGGRVCKTKYLIVKDDK